MPVLIQKIVRMLFLSKGISVQNLKSIGVVEQQIIPAGSKGEGVNNRNFVAKYSNDVMLCLEILHNERIVP